MNQFQRIELLFLELKHINERVSLLEKDNNKLRVENNDLSKDNVKLLKENIELREKIVVLNNRISKLDNPKNSRNSSVPPSKDENRTPKTKSLREQSDRKVGGQKGHEGNTLKMTQTPDEIITYTPDFCGKCGSDIHELQAEFSGKRQVIDIPVVQPFYVEHQVYKKTCSCGHQTCGAYPENVKSSINLRLLFRAQNAFK